MANELIIAPDLVTTPEFKEKIETFNKDFYQKYKAISNESTPQVDGSGVKIIRKRPDNFDYIIEAYMRDCLDRHFPGWSWEAAAPMQVVLNYLLAQGHLIIIDEHLLAFGISPPVRKFYGVGAARIQFKRDSPYTPENVVDIDKNAKSADSNALKYAINRLTRIGDDVYGKRIEEDGAGSYDDVLLANASASSFTQWVDSNKWRYSEIFQILKVKDMSEIVDFKEAYDRVKVAKGIE